MTVSIVTGSHCIGVAQEVQQGERGLPAYSEPLVRGAASHQRQPRTGIAIASLSSASDASGQSQSMKEVKAASDLNNQRDDDMQQQQVHMVWQASSLPDRSPSALANPRPSEQQAAEDLEDDSDDMQTDKRSQTKDRPRKPHLQGRFSGRLETKVCEQTPWATQ